MAKPESAPRCPKLNQALVSKGHQVHEDDRPKRKKRAKQKAEARKQVREALASFLFAEHKKRDQKLVSFYSELDDYWMVPFAWNARIRTSSCFASS